MYSNVFGYMESLSFNVEDTTTWPNFAPNGIVSDKREASLYPSIIEASISIKIIENHKTEIVNGTQTYKYNFDGRGDAHIKETKEVVNKENKGALKLPTMEVSKPDIRNIVIRR
jgi:hypothetical protein